MFGGVGTSPADTRLSRYLGNQAIHFVARRKELQDRRRVEEPLCRALGETHCSAEAGDENARSLFLGETRHMPGYRSVGQHAGYDDAFPLQQ